jgi:hypothetical protein
MEQFSSTTSPFRKIILLILLLVLMTGAWFLIDWSLTGALSTVNVEVGEVASQDIMSPFAISYTSEVLTEEKVQEAVTQVDPVYTRPDPEVARRQLARMREALAFIDSVRADEFAGREDKINDFAALEGIYFSRETAETLLDMSDVRWETVKREAVVVLEQVMRNKITDRTLEEARQSLPSLVSLSLSEEQFNLVVEIASAFVAPNSQFSESLTEERKEEVRQEVTPVTRSIAAGETIVRRGEIIQEEDVEALRQVGLLTPFTGWQNRAGTLAVVFLSGVYLILYFRAYPRLLQSTKKFILLVVFFIIFFGTARVINPGHLVIPYLLPVAGYPLIVSALIDRRTALFTTVPLAILSAYGLPYAFDLTLYYSLPGIMGLMVLRRPQRLSVYVPVSGMIAASGGVILVAYRVIDPGTDIMGLGTLLAAALFFGVASSGLTVLLEYFLAPLLDLTTTLQLIELSRPDHPLLQRFLREVPGTYQHTLQVANLVEQAAERIDANSLLARVGALYHDIGKMKVASFFIENQVSGQIDTHEDMDPEESAEIIIQHVTHGIELARKYRLPKRIRDFIPEHHGTLVARYQYSQAVEAAGGDESQVDIEKFRYPGPKPQSRETGLVMLADACEAYVRSQAPKNEEELRALISEMVNKRVRAGQLNETGLTLAQIEAVIDSFTATLKGTYHARVEYPEEEEAAEDTAVLVDEDGTIGPEEPDSGVETLVETREQADQETNSEPDEDSEDDRSAGEDG